MSSYTDKSDIYLTEECDNQEVIRPGYARVTEILSPWSNFSGIDPEVLKNAADRGTRVHTHCENYANLLKLHACSLFDMKAVDEQCTPYVSSYIQWFDENVDAVYSCEERIYCDRFKFCGKPDQIVHIKGDPEYCLTLIDIKTPQNKSDSWPLQVAAYHFLINTYDYNLCVTRKAVVMCKKSGKIAKLIEYSDSLDIRMFINAAELYHYFNPKIRNKK